MSKHIYKKAGAPTFAPPQIGHHYVDLTSGNQYISKGISSPSDWVLVTPIIDNKLKVSSTDTTVGYLDEKLIVTSGKLTKTIINPTGNEQIELSIGSHVFDKTVDDTNDITEGTSNLYFTQPRVLATPITGFVSGAGTVSATDTILQTVNKINGNVAGKEPTITVLTTAKGGTGLSAPGTSGNVLTSNGTVWVSSASTSSGITSLNTLTTPTQTFANGATGTTPNFSSATSTHTLNIPLASTASVTSGTISKTNFDTFNTKVDGPALSVDSEVALFSGTTGKLLKRATGTGVVHLTSGVQSTSNVVLTSEVTGVLPEVNGGTGTTQTNVTMFTSFNTVFNTPDGVETTVVSNNIFHNPTNAHQADGNVIHFYASGTIGAGVSSTKRIRVFYGAYSIYNSGTIASTAAGSWYLEGYIMRSGINLQRTMTRVICSNGISFSDAQSSTAAEFTGAGASTFRIALTGSNSDTLSVEMSKVIREP